MDNLPPPPPDRVTISCDGRVAGSTLEITHWTGNTTPNSLYADTTTEIALNLAKQKDEYREFENAVVVNNHYDTDGVCSVWACLEPDLAIQYEKVLIEAAEAGDFGEWSSAEGLKLDLIISAFELSDEAAAYETMLGEMPRLLKDMLETDGKAYEKFWRGRYQDAVNDWEDICQGRVQIRRYSRGSNPHFTHRPIRLTSSFTRVGSVVRNDSHSSDKSHVELWE